VEKKVRNGASEGNGEDREGKGIYGTPQFLAQSDANVAEVLPHV